MWPAGSTSFAILPFSCICEVGNGWRLPLKVLALGKKWAIATGLTVLPLATSTNYLNRRLDLSRK